MKHIITSMPVSTHHHRSQLLRCILFAFTCFLLMPIWAEAASLSLTPATGVYTTGGTFTASVVVNTSGQPVNAADATLSFDPSQLSVVSVNRTGSIFNLWVTEPTFSNSNGTISFSGGSPSGYTGSNGRVMNVTFQTKGSGAARVSFTKGSVLANDGRGTNVLTGMSGGSYTIQAKSTAPEPEVIEYVAPANTPGAPVISSATHPDPAGWYATNEAKLSWKLPGDVTAVRTLLDESPSTIPTKVYDEPISSITLSDLSEGESYFHLQFKNADGWGRVTHYRLGVDTKNPNKITVSLPEQADLASPQQTISVSVEDDTSAVRRFMIKIDDREAFEYIDETGSSSIPLPSLEPNFYTVVVTAFDEAGNSIVGTLSFTIESFDRPVFTEYPSEINEEVIPVIKGRTRPGAMVDISLVKLGGEPTAYQISSDDTGEFIFIPEGTFSLGVYELSARATDSFGAVSEESERIRIAVQQPGYLEIGGYIINVLSVVIPLIGLLLILVLGFWYLRLRIARLRKRVRVESVEALQILHREFTSLRNAVETARTTLIDSRRTKKLTKAEAEVLQNIEFALRESEDRVRDEIEDVSELVKVEQDSEPVAETDIPRIK